MTTAVETITSLRPLNLECFSSEDLCDYFTNSWELQNELFRSVVSTHAFYLNPDPLRNPLIFYLGHPAAFFINKLRVAGLFKEHVNAEFERLFAAGVDPETPTELKRAISHISWPKVNEVWEYRSRCFEVVLNIIRKAATNLTNNFYDPIWAFLMGIEHDRIHFETSSMLLRQLPTELLRRPPRWLYAPSLGEPPTNKMIRVQPTSVTLGKPRDFPTYGWDNEYGELSVDVPSFYASKYLVTNREFLDFVEDGGYRECRFWSNEAWAWNRQSLPTMPKFWLKNDGEWRYRTMFEEIQMPWDWPVEVNHHEATAFCKWKGMGTRLLSEAEWNVINGNSTLRPSRYENDNGLCGPHNLNLRFGSPSPVHLPENPSSDLGFFDPMGNVWVWLADDFYPLPGFQPHGLYEGFSSPFFDDRHSMMLGGSWATTGTGASRFYRLWFRRHFYQHAGFRTASSWGVGKTMSVRLR